MFICIHLHDTMIEILAGVSRRQVADKTYYAGLLNTQLAAIEAEIGNLEQELSKAESEQRNLLVYEQKWVFKHCQEPKIFMQIVKKLQIAKTSTCSCFKMLNRFGNPPLNLIIRLSTGMMGSFGKR